MNPFSVDIPGYKIEKLIAEGGMASVYLARQESLARPVALKLLRKFDNPSQALRFFNEGRIIASLEHRNIITIFDLGVVGERHYLAMEFLQGGDLRSRIDAGMTPSEVLDLVETLGLCLSFVHQKGIIHRDIKPENILFRQDGSVVLTDFGVAKQMESNSSLTMDGIMLGSPHYLSPEQAQCKVLDGRADIYSLGIICYEMLTGLKPFQGDSPLDIIIAHLTSELPLLPAHLRFCQPLLARMNAQNPADRFASAAELADFVRHVRAATPKHKLLKRAPPVSRTDKPSVTLVQTVVQTLPLPVIGADQATKGKTYKQAAVGIGLMLAILLTVLILRQPASESTHEQSPIAQSVTSAPQIAQTMNAPSQAAQASTSAPVTAQQVMPDATSRLEQAASILKDKHLTLPKLKEAYDLYQLTLKMNPHQPEALRGVNIIANKFIIIKGEIERNLVLADAAIKSDRLNVPSKNNAADYYRRILELEPGHPEALKGLEKLAGLDADADAQPVP